MDRARKTAPQATPAEVIDFDPLLLNALAPDVRAAVMAEARLLARAFAPVGRRQELEAMSEALSAGLRDRDMDRKHARRLAAALNSLARHAG
jgi:hypothetical protein